MNSGKLVEQFECIVVDEDQCLGIIESWWHGELTLGELESWLGPIDLWPPHWFIDAEAVVRQELEYHE